ncbi:uncharacterized protein LOC131430507 [Malaya genurostris]|uniref:uncharacterized protein LOC131430507 n=1 Tax=Malaya genurostris TaxID=325434 RepID=UPI0026F37F03|nr:uncharacterized protein LOC131430507 [Malaya genurostris]
MYEIISCAKDTQLHTFPALECLCISPHVNNNVSDVQFFPAMKLFLRANKSWGVEMMRIKDVEGKPTISNVKKITMDNLYCVACPKSDREDIAIGLTSGLIRLMNYKKSTNTKRLEADRLANGVTFLDFSATDDFLAAVYESGTVNLFGMKTSSRVATMTFDKHTTKARFHPTRRFLISVASYNGSVMMYDTQTKKIAFNQPEAHGAPCRDIAMAASNPDALFSVGYDNVINIFDTRKKLVASEIRSNYPFESLAVSECGGFFCAGNLKGYVYGYDLRNLSAPIKTSAIHDSIVNSIAFVPKPIEREQSRLSFEQSQIPKPTELVVKPGPVAATATIDSPAPVLGGKSDQDSFMGEIDLFLQRRDSMDYVSRLSSSSRLSTESRGSLNMGGNNLMGYLDDISDSNLDLDQMENAALSNPDQDECFVNVNRLIKRTSIKKQCSVDRTHRSAINLENIREESDVDSSRALAEIPADSNVETHTQKNSNGASKRTSLRRSVNWENKENNFSKLDNTSTPVTDNAQVSTEERVISKSAPLTEIDSMPPGYIQAAFQELKLEMSHMRDDLREEMREHFFQNKVDRKYTAQATRSHTWMGTFNLWRETQKSLERIDEVTQTGFGMLLTNDEFTQRFMALQRENGILKRRIAELEQAMAKQ